MWKKIFDKVMLFFQQCTEIAFDTIYGFWKDDCYTKAATLSFYTLQSIIPILAAALAIAKGFGFEEHLQQQITAAFSEQQEIFDYAIEIARSMLQYISGGVIVGIGILYLFWIVVNVLGYIETVLNQIWNVQTPRSMTQKFKDFLAIIILCPIILVASSSLTIYLRTQIEHLQDYALLEGVSLFFLWMFQYLPWFLSCLLFFFLYLLVPNTKMRVGPRIIGGIIAGTAFQLWQVVYIRLQVEIFSYNVVYGAFAILPLFFIWLQFSWLIALAGAEVAASVEDYIFHETNDKVKINKKQLCLLVLHHCFEKFYAGKKPITDEQISNSLKIQLHLAQNMLFFLKEGTFLASTPVSRGVSGYIPISDPDCFTLKDVLNSLDQNDKKDILVARSKAVTQIEELMKQFDDDMKNSKANIHLSYLVKNIL